MLPDITQDLKRAWLVFAGAAAVVLIAVWIVSDGGEAATQAKAAEDTWGAHKGPVDLRKRVEAQRDANQHLRDTIESLKKDSGFVIDAKRFGIPASEKQPGLLFRNREIEVRQALRQKAQPQSVQYDENVGFPDETVVPPDSEAPYLMTMLQLTERVVNIVLSSEHAPVETFEIHHFPVVETGPVTRPALLREYPLELKVRGSLHDLMWIQHALSLSEENGAHTYPLILQSWEIVSENTKPKDSINQLDAVFRVAGMQFLTPEERDRDPHPPAGHGPVGGRAPASAPAASSNNTARP